MKPTTMANRVVVVSMLVLLAVLSIGSPRSSQAVDLPNEQQLLAIGDRTFLTREKRLEFQHQNLAVFNIVASNHPPKDS